MRPGAELLFLDLDGVAHRSDAGDDELLVRLPLLETWLRARPTVNVVISSSWRHSHSLPQLRALFAQDLQGRVVGATDVHWRSVYEETGEVPLSTVHEREREVLRWLETNEAIGHLWAALDDERGNYVPGRRNVIVCEPHVGLTQQHLAELDRALGFVEPGFLFLDFDGVMHPFGCAIDRYFCHLELLESWLRQRPGVDVVISSSWREVHPLDEMRSFFSEDLQPRILGVAPIIRSDNWAQHGGEPPPSRFEREAEVMRWLQENDALMRSWAALDDDASLYGPANPRLVLCDGMVGLTLRELQKVDEALRINRGAP